EWADLDAILFLQWLAARDTGIVQKGTVAAAEVFDKEGLAFSENASMATADITGIQPQIRIRLTAYDTFPPAQLKLLGITSIIDDSQHSHGDRIHPYWR